MREKRKLAIFVEDILYFGGAEKYSMELGRRLKGFDSTVFSFPRNRKAMLWRRKALMQMLLLWLRKMTRLTKQCLLQLRCLA
jgi:hypothetical protein